MAVRVLGSRQGLRLPLRPELLGFLASTLLQRAGGQAAPTTETESLGRRGRPSLVFSIRPNDPVSVVGATWTALSYPEKLSISPTTSFPVK